MATMSSFSFQNVKPVSTSLPRLKPWNIYTVKFKGCRVDHIDGKKDPSAKYDILKMRFENSEGYYEHSIFFPRPEDAERRVQQNDSGHEYEMPSNHENNMQYIAQLCGVLNQKGYERMQKMTFTSFDEVCTALINATKDSIDKEFKIKLVGKTKTDGTVEPTLPRICAVDNKDENRPLYTSDNFITTMDKDLYWSKWQEGERVKYHTAKPTIMKDNPADVKTDNSDLDISDLEGVSI